MSLELGGQDDLTAVTARGQTVTDDLLGFAALAYPGYLTLPRLKPVGFLLRWGQPPECGWSNNPSTSV